MYFGLKYVSGIYALSHLPLDLVYIGATTDMRTRGRQHYSNLCRERHETYAVDLLAKHSHWRDWHMESLEECDQSDLQDREQYWIDQVEDHRLLNTSDTAKTNMPEWKRRGYVKSDNSRSFERRGWMELMITINDWINE